MRLPKCLIRPTTLAAIGDLLSIPMADSADRYFSSDAFCSTPCHVMTTTVAEEIKESVHWTTATGVRPRCSVCHVSERLTAAMWAHVVGTGELIAFVVEGVRTRGIRGTPSHRRRPCTLCHAG